MTRPIDKDDLLSAADVEGVKQFLASRSVRFREPYARHVTFIGVTGEREFLKPGIPQDRRFWSIPDEHSIDAAEYALTARQLVTATPPDGWVTPMYGELFEDESPSDYSTGLWDGLLIGMAGSSAFIALALWLGGILR